MKELTIAMKHWISPGLPNPKLGEMETDYCGRQESKNEKGKVDSVE
jgi:hypothetical protein